MQSLKSALALLAVALPVAASAQSTPNPPRVSGAPDVRVGMLRTADAPDSMAESGMRTVPGNGQTFALPMAIAKDYRIGPNDLIDVEVLDADNLRRTVRVNAAGFVSLPLIGHVSVAGLTAQEAEERIAARYSDKYLQNPQVSIFIKEFTTERMTIEGAVQHPGIFPLAGQMTLLRALAVAGGFGAIANTKEVMIYRTDDQKVRQSFTFDVEKIRSGEAADPVIRGDDLIVVQRDSTRVILRDSLLRDIVDSVNPFSVLAPR